MIENSPDLRRVAAILNLPTGTSHERRVLKLLLRNEYSRFVQKAFELLCWQPKSPSDRAEWGRHAIDAVSAAEGPDLGPLYLELWRAAYRRAARWGAAEASAALQP